MVYGRGVDPKRSGGHRPLLRRVFYYHLMPNSFGTLAHIANELDAPLKTSIKNLYHIIEEYKKRDFEYISFKDYKTIFKNLEAVHRQLLRCSVTSGRLVENGKRKAKLNSSSSDIHDILQDVCTVVSKQVENKIKFKLVLSKQSPQVAIGHVECFQVVNNLIMNAIQAMPAGGTITIKSKVDTAQKRVVVDIQDQGVGISKEFLANIFQSQRAGLGLAVVHALITFAGGSIDIKSSLRKGTTVRFALPMYNK